MKKAIRLILIIVLACMALTVFALADEYHNPQSGSELQSLLDEINASTDDYYKHATIELESNTTYQISATEITKEGITIRGKDYNYETESPATITVTGDLTLKENDIKLVNIKVVGNVTVGAEVGNGKSRFSDIEIDGNLNINGGGRVEIDNCNISGDIIEGNPRTIDINRNEGFVDVNIGGGNIGKIVCHSDCKLEQYSEQSEHGPITNVDVYANVEFYGNANTMRIGAGGVVSAHEANINTVENNQGTFKQYSKSYVDNLNAAGVTTNEIYGGVLFSVNLNGESELKVMKHDDDHDGAPFISYIQCNGVNTVSGTSEEALIRHIHAKEGASVAVTVAATVQLLNVEFQTTDGADYSVGTITNITDIFDTVTEGNHLDETILNVYYPKHRDTSEVDYERNNPTATFRMDNVNINPNGYIGDDDQWHPCDFEMNIRLEAYFGCQGITSFGFELDLNNIKDYVDFSVDEEGALTLESIETPDGRIGATAIYDNGMMTVTGSWSAGDGDNVICFEDDNLIVKIKGTVKDDIFVGDYQSWESGINFWPLENNGVSNITYLPYESDEIQELDSTYFVAPCVNLERTQCQLGDISGEGVITTKDVYLLLKEINLNTLDKTFTAYQKGVCNTYMSGGWIYDPGYGDYTRTESETEYTYNHVGENEGDYRWQHEGYDAENNTQDALWLLKRAAQRENWFDRIWEPVDGHLIESKLGN